MARKLRSQVPLFPKTLTLQNALNILHIGQHLGLLLPSNSTSSRTVWSTQIIDYTVQRDMVITPAPPPELLPSGSHALEASVVLRPTHQAAHLRVNFATTILDRLASPHNPIVDALLLRTPRTVRQANLRQAYRAAIPSVLEFGARVLSPCRSCQELPTTLIDLSAGGALISLHGRAAASSAFQPGDPIALELDCRAVVASLAVRLRPNQRARFSIPSQVMRATLGPSRAWRHVAIQFQDLPSVQEELLHTIVLKVQQWLASRHQSWGETGWMTTLRSRQVRLSEPLNQSPPS